MLGIINKLSIGFLFGLLACNLIPEGDISQPSEILIMSKEFGSHELKLAIAQDNSVELAPEDINRIYKFLNNKFKTNVDSYHNIVVENVANSDKVNLVMYLKESATNKNIPFALVLQKIMVDEGANPFVYVLSETHTCTGNPCSCCDFIEDGNGNITGCECNSTIWKDGCSGSMCNHTVSTGGGGNYE